MPAYLLTWNPLKWKWQELPLLAQVVAQGEPVSQRWSCGSNTKIGVGDRLFMLAQGQASGLQRGLFASGYALTNAFEAPHWDEKRARRGDTTMHTEVLFDILIDPFSDIGIPREFLDSPSFSDMHWNTQISGIRIPESVIEALELAWASAVHVTADSDELILMESDEIYEGAPREAELSLFERDRTARLECILHFGAACQVCGFDFGEEYGLTGQGYIQVHHLVPLADIRAEYRVDPIADLRPVCPNCHAMLHRRNPPFTIGELRDMRSEKRRTH